MAIQKAPTEHAWRAALHQLGGVLCNLDFLKRGLDDLATLDVGNVPCMVGFKVCIYTVPPEYGEYSSSQWAPLANRLHKMGNLM